MVHNGLWHDLRTPDFYFAALKDTLRFALQHRDDPLGLIKARGSRGLPSFSAEEDLLIDTDQVHPQATVRPFTVIEKGASLTATASTLDSVILPEARIETSVVRCIVGRDFSIPLAESTV
jgi:NDP-sugar pyrophosphorylase family protein